jgi:hypothetical protein
MTRSLLIRLRMKLRIVSPMQTHLQPLDSNAKTRLRLLYSRSLENSAFSKCQLFRSATQLWNGLSKKLIALETRTVHRKRWLSSRNSSAAYRKPIIKRRHVGGRIEIHWYILWTAMEALSSSQFLIIRLGALECLFALKRVLEEDVNAHPGFNGCTFNCWNNLGIWATQISRSVLPSSLH